MTDRRFVYKKIEMTVNQLISSDEDKEFYDILEKDFKVRGEIVEVIYRDSLLSVYKTMRYDYEFIEMSYFKVLLLKEITNRIWNVVQGILEFLKEEDDNVDEEEEPEWLKEWADRYCEGMTDEERKKWMKENEKHYIAL
jgi:hypothetical protein